MAFEDKRCRNTVNKSKDERTASHLGSALQFAMSLPNMSGAAGIVPITIEWKQKFIYVGLDRALGFNKETWVFRVMVPIFTKRSLENHIGGELIEADILNGILGDKSSRRWVFQFCADQMAMFLLGRASKMSFGKGEDCDGFRVICGNSPSPVLNQREVCKLNSNSFLRDRFL